MSCVTAETAASFWVGPSTVSGFEWGWQRTHRAKQSPFSVTERYLKLIGTRRTVHLGDEIAEQGIPTIYPFGAAWLGDVSDRIRKSVKPPGMESESEGMWLTTDVADAALGFFNSTSDVLPSRPFIYSSREGHLVAEFEAAAGTLTAVISPSHVVAFAVIGDSPEEIRSEMNNESLSVFRSRIDGLSKAIKGADGAMVP